MYSVNYTNKFKHALRKAAKRGLDIQKLESTIGILAECGSLPMEFRPHKLSGKFHNAWECHIQSDWLLVWEQNDTELTLLFIDTGSHADIFG